MCVTCTFPLFFFKLKVTHLPLNLSWSSRGARFQHVGIGIRLPQINCIERQSEQCRCCRSGPTLRYLKKESWCRSYGRALVNSGIFHIPLPWRIRVVHALDEHQKRILFGQTYYKNPKLEMSIEELYASMVWDRASNAH